MGVRNEGQPKPVPCTLQSCGNCPRGPNRDKRPGRPAATQQAERVPQAPREGQWRQAHWLPSNWGQAAEPSLGLVPREMLWASQLASSLWTRGAAREGEGRLRQGWVQGRQATGPATPTDPTPASHHCPTHSRKGPLCQQSCPHHAPATRQCPASHPALPPCCMPSSPSL